MEIRGEEVWVKDHQGRIKTTYSFWTMFQQCRMKCYLRYGMGLVRKGDDQAALYIGSLVHEGLEVYHKTGVLIDALKAMTAYAKKNKSDKAQLLLARAEAMIRGYARQYAGDNFKVIFAEAQFSGPIYNLKTGRQSRSLSLAGKMDMGASWEEGKIWIFEHKTCQEINQALLSQIWTYAQTRLYYAYVHYMEDSELRTSDLKVMGVVYNWLGKTRVKEKPGETEQEFLQRKAGLEAKSGKTSRAKQQMPSTPTDIFEKVSEKIADSPTEYLHREKLLLTAEDIRQTLEDLWDMSKDFLACRANNRWYQNTSSCFNYNKPCPYYDICSTGGNPNVVENLYEVKKPNEELEDTVT